MTEQTLITTETVRALNPMLRKTARKLMARPADAEDLLQETWCSALKGASSFAGRSSLSTWLVGIMKRRYIDRLRRDRLRLSLDEDELPADPAHMPLELLLQVRAVEQATGALCTLTQLERGAVTLCDMDELERPAAAAQLHVSREHLRVALHRARNKLACALSSWNGGLVGRRVYT